MQPCTLMPPAQLDLFPPSEVLMRLKASAAAMRASSHADNTRRAYKSDWSDFVRWCETVGRPSIPAAAETVEMYLAWLVELGRKVSTIGRRVSAIAAMHEAAGRRSPISASVREVLAGARRELGVAPHGRAALTVEDLLAIRGTLDLGSAIGIRDWAILVFGFAAGLRRSELVGLDRDDVRFVRQCVIVRLRRSKTDQEGVGREFGVFRGRRRSTCPVAALEAWMVKRGGWRGPLFVRAGRRGALTQTRLDAGWVLRVVKHCVGAIGLDASEYGAHSLRAGCATAAGEKRVPDYEIMQRTGHRSVAMVAKYVRPATLFVSDPLAGVL
jgi:integrase